MKKTIVIFLVILVLLYLAYKFIFKSEDGTPCSTTGGTINDGIIVNGACVSSQVSNSNGTQQLNVNDYFVTGNDVHDKDVFEKGLACAKAFVYKNTNDPMANNIITTLSLSGRGAGDSTACKTIHVNCSVAQKISSLSSDQTGSILNYLYNLQVQNDWKKFSNMAAGHKNMCSVILEQALKTALPAIYATVGRG